jgi:hypothetical protein
MVHPRLRTLGVGAVPSATRNAFIAHTLLVFALPAMAVSPLAGDVDESGAVNIVDLQLVVVDILSGIRYEDMPSDIDRSGRTDVRDLQDVVAAILGEDIDPDKDGLANSAEANLGTLGDAWDSDGDGLGDMEELLLGTDPTLPDTDGDGIPDKAELDQGLNPNNRDTDSDTIEDGEELALGTDPTDFDTDGDALNDGLELLYGSNPLFADSDGDGLDDFEELIGNTDFNNRDTDGDGLEDGLEVELGTDPTVAETTITVEGAMQYEDGSPVPNAEVTILESGQSATADAQGLFRVDDVPVIDGGVTVRGRTIKDDHIHLGTAEGVTRETILTVNTGPIALAPIDENFFPGRTYSLGDPAIIGDPERDNDVVWVDGESITTWEHAHFTDNSSVIDMNNDGLLDVVTLVQVSDGQAPQAVLTCALGKPDGTFATPIMSNGIAPLINSPNGPFPHVPYNVPNWAGAGDFDNDGFTDVVVHVGFQFANENAGTYVSFGVGDGTTESPLFLGEWLNDVQITDANSDERNDIVGLVVLPERTGEGASYQFVLYLSNGDRTFSQRRSPVMELVSSWDTYQAADLNGDGNHDFVFATQFATRGAVLSRFMSRPDGSYGPEEPMGGWLRRNSLRLHDTNNDEHLDIVGHKREPETGLYSLDTYLNNGDGTFQDELSLTYEGEIDSYLFLDADGDDVSDVAISYTDRSDGLYESAAAVHRGKGDGTYHAAQQMDLRLDVFGLQFEAFEFHEYDFRRDHSIERTALVGDFNQDGYDDIAMPSDYSEIPWGGEEFSSEGNRGVGVLMSNGDGFFTWTQHLNGDTIPRALSDVNGDGYLDLLHISHFTGGSIRRAARNFSVVLGQADGMFENSTLRASYELFSNDVPVMVRDVNGDGRLDLIHGGWDGPWVSLAVGDGNYEPGVQVVARGAIESFDVGDVNRDGKLDFVITGKEGVATFHAGRGNGTFAPWSPISEILACRDFSLADVNHDNRLDIVAEQRMGAADVHVFLGDGRGEFVSASHYDHDILSGSIYVGDLDLDGHLDNILVGESKIDTDEWESVLAVLLGNGDGTFRPGQRLIFADDWEGRWDSFRDDLLSPGDFNHDGYTDLVLTPRYNHSRELIHTRQVLVFLNNGDATFRPGPPVYSTSEVGNAVVVADINMDGVSDLVVNEQGTLSVLQGRGDGSFLDPVGFLGLTNQQNQSFSLSFAVTDVDQDGKPDIVGNGGRVLTNFGFQGVTLFHK